LTVTPNPSSGFRRARTIVLGWKYCFARAETAAAGFRLNLRLRSTMWV
jgi:hypothetical protein